MSELSTNLYNALQQDRLVMFGFVKIVTPSTTIRLLDGSAQVVINGETYSGVDPTFGTLDYIKGLQDKLDNKAPEIQLGLIPSGDAALSTLIDPTLQGSSIIVGIGSVDPMTGLSVDNGYVMFSGQLDTPTIKWGANDRRIEFVCTTSAERMFNIEEGRRLSNAFHQTVWPSENGLFAVTDVEYAVPWGDKFNPANYSVRTDGGAGGGYSLGRGGGSSSDRGGYSGVSVTQFF
jgi:hypothetical protein